MAHQSLEELVKKLIDAEREVEVGARYTHYKNRTKEYVVKSLALLEATDEVVVIYEAEYNTPRVSFVRPLSSWCALVEVNGVSTTRFTKLK